jgi:FlaA1/EpsC-like NDP-sugar epimerase
MSIESKLSKIGRALDMWGGIIRERFFCVGRRKRDHTKHRSDQIPWSIISLDASISFTTLFLTIYLRIGVDFLEYSPFYILKNMFVFGLVSVSTSLWLNVHQPFWKYTSIEDAIPVLLSVLLSNIIFFPLMMLMNQEDFLPYSVLVINAFVLAFTLLLPRFLSRILYNKRISKVRRFEMMAEEGGGSVAGQQSLLVGSSKAIDVFLGEIFQDEEAGFNFQPVGILTVNPSEVGRTIRGIRILGEVRHLGSIMRELRMGNVYPKQILTIGKILPEQIKKFLVKHAEENGLILSHIVRQYSFSSLQSAEA